MKTNFLLLVVSVCLIAAPAKADLFDFHLYTLHTIYDGGVSVTTTSICGLTLGYSDRHPVQFSAPLWGTGSEWLSIEMTLSNLTSMTADATGTIQFWDVDGDKIAANLSGTWNCFTLLPTFDGELTNVTFTPAAATFDGHTGSVNMAFEQPQPWLGSIFQLVTTTQWFTPGVPLSAISNRVDAYVVPVPGAVLLGMIGLSIAGVKLRRHAS